MNKLKRLIQRNQRKYVKALCATILTSKRDVHKRLPWTVHMTKEQYHEYSTSEERARDLLYDKLRDQWYTKFAQTPLQMANELPHASNGKIARFIYAREFDHTIRAPASRNMNRPWGTYFHVKFPMVMFNCGQDIFIEQRLHELESHYVLWQDDQYKIITTGFKESHLV